jgi:hypothetical protein
MDGSIATHAPTSVTTSTANEMWQSDIDPVSMIGCRGLVCFVESAQTGPICNQFDLGNCDRFCKRMLCWMTHQSLKYHTIMS